MSYKETDYGQLKKLHQLEWQLTRSVFFRSIPSLIVIALIVVTWFS